MPAHMNHRLRCVAVAIAAYAILASVAVYPNLGGDTVTPMTDTMNALPRAAFSADPRCARLTFLSWDTEIGARARQTLLRAGEAVELWIKIGTEWKSASAWNARVSLPTPPEDRVVYKINFEGGGVLNWEAWIGVEQEIQMRVTAGNFLPAIESLELRFPFDATVTPTAVLAASWETDNSIRLPAIVNAPDFGAMRLTSKGDASIRGWVKSNVHHKSTDLILEIPKLAKDQPFQLTVQPFHLDPPRGVNDNAAWRQARRGWLNGFQLMGLQTAPERDAKLFPAGCLGNDVTTAAVSCSLWFYAGQAFWTPQLSPDVSAAGLLRRTLDHMLDRRVLASGKVLTWSGYDPPSDGIAFPEAVPGTASAVHYVDSLPSTLISAWCYVESTGDIKWLEHRIEVLERIGGYLVGLDLDRDGLIETERTGNRGGLVEPARGESWWDAVNAGHKNAYLNLLAYRALRQLADLEDKLGRMSRRDYFAAKADRLKSSFYGAFFNPETGWLAWWRSTDGELHDFASPFITGMAVEYGIVDRDMGRQMLLKLNAKMQEVGFTRFDLGVPCTLVPIPRDCYLIAPTATLGPSLQADGSDGFQHYMNGSTNATFTLRYLAALHVVGEQEEADRILRAMLGRQSDGKFQNGKKQAVDAGVEWTTWDGSPSGADGYLADTYQFLQALMLREPAMRERWYRPLHAPAASVK